MSPTEATTTRWQLVRAFAALAVVLALLGAAVYGAVVALDHLRTGVAAGVVTASATVLISVITLVWSQRADRRRAIEQTAREQKLGVYDELLQFWLELTLSADEFTPEELVERWKNFNRERLHTVVLWLPEPVLAAYNRFRSTTVPGELAADSYDLIFAFEDLLLAIRKDLGHSNAGINRGDLLRLWINDVDDALLASLGSGAEPEPPS
jgi:hypothetical protein